jgi:diguanylate cyclase (GGDEF)-like protein
MRDKSTIKVITWLTAIILGGLIVIVPLGYFIVSYHYVEGILETEAENIATTITQKIININPELWEFNHTRLNGYITLRPKDGSAEIRRILNIKDELVVEYADKLEYPVVTRSSALKDSGMVVGRLEITRTLRPLLIRTGFITLLVSLFSSGIFILLRIFPVRMLYQAEEQIILKNQEIELRNVELSTLYKISSVIGRTIDMNDLFSNILNTILEIDILKVERKGGILLIDGDKMNLVSHLGHPKSFLNMHENMTVNDCLCGLAARTGEIIISKNSHTDCNHTIAYPEMTPHGHLIIPLKAIDKIMGVLYLYLPVDFDIDERTIQTFIAIGNQIGIAINNCLLYEKAKMLSLYDPLTKVANRNLMNMELEKNYAKSKRYGNPFSIIIMDLDNFKYYNDTYGHIAGDKLLVMTANIFSKEVREIDLVVRYGGEEFLIILPETKLIDAHHIAERIRKSIEEKTDVTISIGIVSHSHEIENTDDLIKKADAALYQAKQKGKNRVEIWQN